MKPFTLVGVDGNAYSVMGYTAQALRKAGLKDLIDEMHAKATSDGYNNLICVCMEYIDKANKAIGADEYEE